MSRKGLQQNLSDLHDRVNRIHENYIRVEDEITKNLEHSLKDLLYTRADRRYKLHAWKLQLKEYLWHANLIDRLHSTAGRELQYEQKKAFDSIFEDIAKNDFLEIFELQNKSPTSDEEIKELSSKIDAIYKRIEEKETPIDIKVNNAQIEFAKRHNLKLHATELQEKLDNL